MVETKEALDKVETWAEKFIGYVMLLGLLLSGCSIILWPLVFFGSIFIFDAPIRDDADQRFRNLVFIWLNSYPVTFGLSFWYLMFTLKQTQRIRIWHIPIAWLAFMQLVFPFVFAELGFL